MFRLQLRSKREKRRWKLYWMFVWGMHNGRAFSTRPQEPSRKQHRAYLSAFARGFAYAQRTHAHSA
jgi:hypothetical protein